MVSRAPRYIFPQRKEAIGRGQRIHWVCSWKSLWLIFIFRVIISHVAQHNCLWHRHIRFMKCNIVTKISINQVSDEHSIYLSSNLFQQISVSVFIKHCGCCCVECYIWWWRRWPRRCMRPPPTPPRLKLLRWAINARAAGDPLAKWWRGIARNFSKKDWL